MPVDLGWSWSDLDELCREWLFLFSELLFFVLIYVYVDKRDGTVILQQGWIFISLESNEIKAVFMFAGNVEFYFISVIALLKIGAKIDKKYP